MTWRQIDSISLVVTWRKISIFLASNEENVNIYVTSLLVMQSQFDTKKVVTIWRLNYLAYPISAQNRETRD